MLLELTKKRETTNMKTRMPFVAFACAAVWGSALGAINGYADASIVIDDFTNVHDPNPWPVNRSTLGSETVFESGLNTLGGTRETLIEATFLGLDGVDSINVNIAPGAGLFGYFSSSDAAGFVSLLYDGGGSLNADFSQQVAIEIDFAFFDFANSNPLPITAILSDGVNTATRTVSLNSPGAQTAAFLFNDFTNIGLLDLASIQSIQFEFDPGLAADFQLGSISTVLPTPGALALLGIAGFTGVRRRRN